MSTHLAVLQAKHEQAVLDPEVAELALAAAMRGIEPSFAGSVPAAVLTRRWEARAEDVRNIGFAKAWSSYMRARRLESRARSAAHMASFQCPLKAGPSIAPSTLTAGDV